MSGELPPISIFIDGAPYKSIRQLTWENVPGFAVLTGLNGSGKTQLLEILAYRILGNKAPGVPNISSNLRIEDLNLKEGDVAYAPSGQVYGNGPATGIAAIQNERNNIFNLLTQYQPHMDVATRIRKARIEKLIDYKAGQSREEIEAKLPKDFLFMLDDVNISAKISYVFYAYYLQSLELLDKVGSREEVRRQMGTPPWELLNDVLQSAAFPYRAKEPESLAVEYSFTLIDVANSETRNPNDLSSGEKVILEMVLWLYNADQRKSLPKLFLLDEPDAHLHPSMARQFIDVLNEVIVKKHKVRVIMSTHSPSTVALAPDGSLFEMVRGGLHVTASQSKAKTLGFLSSGLVIVSPGTKYVLVEDEDDIDFFQAVRDILTDYGPSRDRAALKPSPSIVFLPACTGRGKDKTGGGCTVVRGWVEKFDQEPLKQMFRGIIDRDKGNSETDRVYVTVRYAIENYFLDPLNVFCLLSQRGEAPPIEGVTITTGDEHCLRTMDRGFLQKISDCICAKVESDNVGLTDNIPTAVEFTNGIKIDYPKWMIEFRGHDLLPKFQKSWGGTSIINISNLVGSYRRLRIIPVELASILSRMQN